jgi:nucleotide-binding universal stress UspA family protein
MNAFHGTGLFSIRDVLLGEKCEKVLCWVDSADRAEPVVEVAKTFAAIGSEPCHVVMCLDPEAGNGKAARRTSAPLTPEVICSAKERLKGLYGSDVHTVVLPGHSLTELRRYARHHHADLIVVGRQGRAVEKASGEQLSDGVSCAVLTLILPLEEARIVRHKP